METVNLIVFLGGGLKLLRFKLHYCSRFDGLAISGDNFVILNDTPTLYWIT